MTQKLRRLPLIGASNARDLGGYPLRGGGSTRWQVFFRSDEPCGFGQEQSTCWVQNGIQTVIDLRAPEKAVPGPASYQGRVGIRYYNFPICGSDLLPNSPEEVPFTYLRMAERRDSMRQVFQTMAETSGACLYHCTWGKDRTGVVTALLLQLAGVNDADILADYTVSAPYLAKESAVLLRDHPDFPRCRISSDPACLEEFFRLFRARYSGMEEYLSFLGLPSSQTEKLQRKLTGS